MTADAIPVLPRPSLTVRCEDPAATTRLGERLGAVARAGDLVCLWGDLGAGKTHLAKAFGAGLGVTATITSPSFILMAEYAGRLPLFHLDPYRLIDARDALAGGLLDEGQADGVTVIEWPERLADALPDARLDVRIDGTGDDPRSITLTAMGPAYERYLEAAR
ncbi:MAG: tRNA (adenosine(37)-N6)-threonylcarbamoyltransferase complex ATPase subunit type 1 TsaE [Candidatus Limnocylindria bacterium]